MSLSPGKGSRCFLEQETSLLIVLVGSRNRFKRDLHISKHCLFHKGTKIKWYRPNNFIQHAFNITRDSEGQKYIYLYRI